MPPQFPSIQSFFQSSKSSSSKQPAKHSSKPPTAQNALGDGFTADEVNAVLHPKIDNSWTPTKHYEDVDIASLVPGPHRVTFQGRIVNLYDQQCPSKKPRAAKGCVKCIVKDDSGAMTVRMSFFEVGRC
jgi:hypothetical protein